jgi:hypothetical protein
MKKKINILNQSICFFLSLLIVSCVPFGEKNSAETTDGSNEEENKLSVLYANIDPGFGFYLKDNPIIVSGDPDLGPDIDLTLYLDPEPQFITYNTTLNDQCNVTNSGSSFSVSNCFAVKKNPTASLLNTTNGRWSYFPNSSEFLQVHTFAHLRKIIEKFQNQLIFSYTYTNPEAPNTSPYTTSIPSSLFSTYGFWYPDSTLQAYSECEIDDNAYFAPATFSICLGQDSLYEKVKLAQDPTIIYHEMGHALIQIILNMRNTASGKTLLGERVDLGYGYYDEAGSLGEAISDYFSFIMNKRPHVFEWGLGRFSNASRPMSERDIIHAAGIDVDSYSRLAYPDYVNYDPNFLDESVEDVHNAGMIASHYLVALTEDLVSTCSMTIETSILYVLHNMFESLAELGDLSALSSDSITNPRINLDGTNSAEWIRIANPINFRSFFQTFAKKLYLTLNQQSLCNGAAYTTDKIEQLLDDYGLLLFRTYNLNGNGVTDVSGTPEGHTGTNVQVSDANRVKTVLISKDFVELEARQELSEAYIFDKRSDIISAINELQAAGQIGTLSDQVASDLPYNNGNGQIGPGEVIGVSLNLYNSSNSPIAGVQILANDWDHVDSSRKPCNNFEDEFPLDSEGGSSTNGCETISTDNGITGTPMEPICLVQKQGENYTEWISQQDFVSEVALPESKCLGGSSDTSACFIRAIRGADQAIYSKIDPFKNWAETIRSDGQAPEFSFSNIMFFEVNSYIPPGTTFDCRFRVRFSNCDDCYHDSSTSDNDDYIDNEYSGNKPFKIIHFQFTVID